MANGKRAAAVVWRTVVCAAIVPGCRHDAAKPHEPDPTATVDEDEDEDDGEYEDDAEEPDRGCGYLDVSTELDRDPGDQEDGVIHLRLVSVPPGALVEIDGEDTPRGVTPIDVELPVMMYNRVYSLTLDGYDGAGGILDQGDDRDVAMRFDLVTEEVAAARPRCPEDDDDRPPDFGFIVS